MIAFIEPRNTPTGRFKWAAALTSQQNSKLGQLLRGSATSQNLIGLSNVPNVVEATVTDRPGHGQALTSWAARAIPSCGSSPFIATQPSVCQTHVRRFS